MQTRGELTPASLAEALDHLRSAVADTAYPLVMPSAADAREAAAALVAQLDDYLIPRLARLDAPLLAVVGGSTGAGKSTLVNSLVAAKVTTAGVLRPTTRAPLLAANPADLDWFRRGELLPGLTRTTEPSTDPKSLQLVGVPTITSGLALLDAPDIDSVVDANRALAGQLLAAADLWVFVTTAARYADAVPWGLLRTARHRGTVIAMVLDRVPPDAAEEIAAHLNEMLRENDLGAAPLFIVPETRLAVDGLLPPSAIGDLSAWLGYLGADAGARAAVVRRTLDGAIAATAATTASLATASEEQLAAVETLTERVEHAYRAANRAVAAGVEDGRLLRGEVLARWQEFVGTGELMRTLEAQIGRLRDRVVATLTGRPAPGHALRNAIESNLVTLIRGAADEAAEQAYSGWQAHPAGAALLSAPLAHASPDLSERAERLIRDWQRHVLELVRTEAGDKRAVARGTAYAVNATGLLVMVVVFASTAFIPTGAEVAVAGGTTVAAQKVLEAIFGDQAIRLLAAKARTDLLDRVAALLAEESARFTALVGPVEDSADRLREAALLVETSRAHAGLVTP
nr:ABC transporter [Catenuloplanes japonicus]